MLHLTLWNQVQILLLCRLICHLSRQRVHRPCQARDRPCSRLLHLRHFSQHLHQVHRLQYHLGHQPLHHQGHQVQILLLSRLISHLTLQRVHRPSQARNRPCSRLLHLRQFSQHLHQVHRLQYHLGHQQRHRQGHQVQILLLSRLICHRLILQCFLVTIQA